MKPILYIHKDKKLCNDRRYEVKYVSYSDSLTSLPKPINTYHLERFDKWYDLYHKDVNSILSYILKHLNLDTNILYSLGINSQIKLAEYIYKHSISAYKGFHKVLR